jgi:hypothetical protein
MNGVVLNQPSLPNLGKAARFDQGGNIEIFVDGTSRGTTTTNNNPLDGSPSIMIGGNILDSRYFSGLIDEVAYYPTVLSVDRIKAHYLAGSFSIVPTLRD